MRKTLGLACVMAASLMTSYAAVAVPRQQYDALIRGARAGNYEPALVMLRQHAIEHPRDLRAAYDHILIADWAGHSKEVVAAYEAIQPAPNRMPADALLAVARAYRDTQQWDAALARYQEGKRRYPRRSAFAIGEIMTLSDAGKSDLAVALGKERVMAAPRDADARLALGYAYNGAGLPYAALQEAHLAEKNTPNKDYVTRDYIDTLQRTGLAYPALNTARKSGVVPAKQMRTLQADYAAELARLSAMPVREESERFAIADRALAEYDRLIPAWVALGPDAGDDVIRLGVDRLQALNSRMRMRDVVKEYEKLVAEGVDVPRYALNDVASAYLYLREPEAASALYEQNLAKGDPKRDDANERLASQSGLYYSLIESENFDLAGATIEEAQASQPTWRRIRGVPQNVPNDLHLYTEQTAALGLFYVDDTEGADRRLTEMVNTAPRNVGLRTALANVYRGRGWPRRAEVQLKMAEALEPRATEVEAGQGLTALELQEWRQAEQLKDSLAARFPAELSTLNLEREWAKYQKAELRVQANKGIASDSPVSGSGDLSIDTVLYSAPLNYNWRVFGGGGYATGDFEEGTGHYRWLRTGVEWRGRDLTAELEVSTNNYGFGTKPGARVTAAYDFNDQWQVGGSLEWLSRDTPLRALRSDISSNAATAFVRWHQSDQREWTFSVTPSHFSDGNDRLVGVISGRERLYTAPTLKADLLVNIAASRNSSDEGPYYSPRADLEVLPTLNITHLLYRHYETTLEQTFLLGAGTYSQRGHGTGAIGALGYGLRYRYNDVFDIGATVTGVSRPYDGVRERELRVMLDINFRF
jgi:biofilm PGA synthesis protein PgaA